MIFGKQPKQPYDVTSNDSSHGIIQFGKWWLEFIGQFWDDKLDTWSEKKDRNQGVLFILPVVLFFRSVISTFGAQYMAWNFGRGVSIVRWIQQVFLSDFGWSHVLSIKGTDISPRLETPQKRSAESLFSNWNFLFKTKKREIWYYITSFKFCTMADLPERTTGPLKKQQ